MAEASDIRKKYVHRRIKMPHLSATATWPLERDPMQVSRNAGCRRIFTEKHIPKQDSRCPAIINIKKTFQTRMDKHFALVKSIRNQDREWSR